MRGVPSVERGGRGFATLLTLVAACLLPVSFAAARTSGGSVQVVDAASRAHVQIAAHVRHCPALAVVRVDGRRLARFVVRRRRVTSFRLRRAIAPGRHRVRVSAARGRGCRRPGLVVDAVRIRPGGAGAQTQSQPPQSGAQPPASSSPASPQAAATHPDPLAGTRFYVNPHSNAAQTEAQWRAAGRIADADAMDKIAANPQAVWFGDWNGSDPSAAVRTAVSAAHGVGTVPVLVAYDIPSRDCGGYSAGGASSAGAYRSWIDGFASGLDGPAAVVLEPDALPEIDCLDAAGQQSALALLRYAVGALSQRSGVAVYIDAGNAGWQPPATIAARLEQAGVDQAAGFSLNVSNFDSSSSETAYGHQISALTHGSHFVIDTSRNGQGPAPDGQWCNPPGRGLGHPASAVTGDPLVDAFLWVKAPGESDGTCNGGPPAGQWWPDYALGLAQRASF